MSIHSIGTVSLRYNVWCRATRNSRRNFIRHRSEASKSLYEAARNSRGLHASFRRVSDSVPLILRTLRQAEAIQKRNSEDYSQASSLAQRQAILEESTAIQPIVVTCRSSAETLSKIFAAAIPGAWESRSLRYAKAIKTILPGKQRKVAQLLREILENLQLLHTYHSFKAMGTADELQYMTQQLLNFQGQSTAGRASSTSSKHRQALIVEGDTPEVDQRERWDHAENSSSRGKGEDFAPALHTHIWNNADGTKIANQNSVQNVHG